MQHCLNPSAVLYNFVNVSGRLDFLGEANVLVHGQEGYGGDLFGTLVRWNT